MAFWSWSRSTMQPTCTHTNNASSSSRNRSDFDSIVFTHSIPFARSSRFVFAVKKAKKSRNCDAMGMSQGIGMWKTDKMGACERNAQSVLFFRAHNKSDSKRHRDCKTAHKDRHHHHFNVCVCASIVCISNECFVWSWMFRFLFAIVAFIEDLLSFFIYSFLFRLHFSEPLPIHFILVLLLAKHSVACNSESIRNDLLHGTCTQHTQWHPIRSFRMAKMKGIAEKCIRSPAARSACCENWFDV